MTALHPTAPPEALAASPSPSVVRILHLTDLHYGRGFNEALWDNVKALAPPLSPHLVIVTGDLVNSPFVWCFRAARDRLQALRDALAAAGQTPPLIVIPGNHDTRLFGILPIVWIIPWIIVPLFAIAIAAMALGFVWTGLTIGLLACVALIFRLSCLVTFTRFFTDLIPDLPMALPELGVVLYAFDSATYGTSAACGEIPLAQFVKARAAPPPSDEVPYGLALVHHHVLPIPYDSEQETMMILKNAGAFLSEATKNGIRLVLSGHKHHQHFSRVTISPEPGDDHDSVLSVLCTGTPTAQRHPGRFGFNFSLVNIHWRSDVEIVRYHAAGGAFNRQTPFWAESLGSSVAARLRQDVRGRKCRADEIVVTAKLSPDGDVERTNEVRGFQYRGSDKINVLPGEIIANVDIGQIERLAVFTSQGALIDSELEWRRRERRHQQARIRLTRPIDEQQRPFDFGWGYHGLNAYAMSAQQFGLMYRNPGNPVETLALRSRHIPVSKASIHIEFPAGFVIDDEPWLSVVGPDGAEVSRLADAYRGSLSYDAQANTIDVELPFVPLGLLYRVQWRLKNDPPPTGRMSILGQARRTADRLLLLARDARQNPLSDLLAVIDAQARDAFSLEPGDQDPLLMSIMAFDQQAKQLVVAAANYRPDDPHWEAKLDYGDGIAGRTFKMNRVTRFVKEDAKKNRTPFYYVPVGGEAVADDGSNVPIEAQLSLPLWHPQQPDAIFGILSLASKQGSSRLVDISADAVTTAFRQAVSQACFEAVNDLF